MATKKKMLQAAAGNAGGDPLDIDEVFSTYLYTGDGTNRNIINGIDLSDEGGMVWVKNRDGGDAGIITDTARGVNKGLNPADTGAADTNTNRINGFRSDGFSVGGSSRTNAVNGDNYASWTFRKAPKFFDVVTWTGTGSAQNISHSLGSVPGMILVCNTGSDANWGVYHRQLNNGTDRGHWRIQLNTTSAQVNQSTFWNDTAPTDSVFTVGSNAATNDTNNTYVAYLFAHNDGDGEFGPDGDQDIIKCGSYTGNGSTDGPVIDLGFEPQWFMWKRTDSSANWQIIDNMRGISYGESIPGDPTLAPNESYAENPDNNFNLTATGLKCHSNNTTYNGAGGTYAYVAIRRGPLAQPESATEVFAPAFYGTAADSKAPAFRAPFAVDAALQLNRSGNAAYPFMLSRLTGTGYLTTSNTNAESSSASNTFDYNNGYNANAPSSEATVLVGHQFRRAPGYFDVVAYSGNSTAGRTVSHNLGVAPEMMWVKKRNAARSWKIYNSATGSGKAFEFDTATAATSPAFWNNTNPTESAFTLGSSETVNGTGDTYISYLFASLPGISKVGSYTGTGATLNIDCGFTSGARFVLIKNTTGGNWYVYDTARGIVSGNDPALELNSTSAEDNQYDSIDPYSAGFTLTAYGASSPSLNTPSETYIFYAIA